MQAKLYRHAGRELSPTGWGEVLGLTRQAVAKRLRTMPVSEALAPAEERKRLWSRNLRRAKSAG